MARDRKNIDQMTPKQIRAKINLFKKVPEQYAEYLVKKGEIILEDPEPLKKVKTVYEELKRPTSEASKNKKARKLKNKETKSIISSIWEEEDMSEDQEEEENEKSVNEVSKKKHELQKLKLFPDEDTDEDDKIELLGEDTKVRKQQKITQFHNKENYKRGKKRLRIK